MSDDYSEAIETAKEKFGKLLEEQLARVDRLKQESEWTDYSALEPIIIGICPGDGIGPEISRHAVTIMNHVLEDQVNSGKIEFRQI